MEEKNYKNNIESAAMAEDFSLEDILDEYRVPAPELSFEQEGEDERSRRIVLEALDEVGGHSSISSIDELVDEAVGETMREKAVNHALEEDDFSDASDKDEADEEAEVSGEETVEEAVEPQISEYEVRELVDSDERDAYASYDIDYELGEEEYVGEEPPAARRDPKRRRAGKHGGKRAALSPIVALLALMTNKRSQRAKADGELPTVDDEDSAIPEMEPEKAVKLYSAQMPSMNFRAKVASAVSIVMLYISFGAFSFLPLFGAMKGPIGASLTLMIMLLTVIICGLDVFTVGLLNLFRGRPGFETLVSFSCLLALIDAASIVIMRTGDLGLPFCAISAVSMSFAIWGNYFNCKGLRCGFKVAGSKKAVGVSSENGLSGKGSAIFKSFRGIKGFIRRSEEADVVEYIYSILTPLILIAALIFGLLAAFVNKRPETLIHSLSMMLACSAVFSGGIAFAHPFAVTAGKLLKAGSAISGWAGVRDIGRSRGVVITDEDIFPRGSVDISGIRVLQDMSADKVISYTGSVIAASASGLAPAFTDLIRRNSYSICRVENFAPHDGGGLTAVVNGENIMVGNAGFMNLMGIRVPQKMANRNTVFTAISGELSGLFDIEYKPMPAVQDALGVLLRSGCDAVFALRDFNMTPDSIRTKFLVVGEAFNLPSYPERFRISGTEPDPNNPIAAVIANESIVPVCELSKRGKRLYFCVMAAAAIAAAGSVIGLLAMFLASWMGAFGIANVALVALVMLLWLIPNVLIGLWLQR